MSCALDHSLTQTDRKCLNGWLDLLDGDKKQCIEDT